MADPRFYDNCGPFTVAEICSGAEAALPPDVDGTSLIADIADLSGAGPEHLSFFSGARAAAQFAASAAGYCFVPAEPAKRFEAPARTIVIPCTPVTHAFAVAAHMFYPKSAVDSWEQTESIHPTAKIGEGVILAPGVMIGPGAEIGDLTRIGPNTVIGRGVTIGRRCEIGSNITIGRTYIGDDVLILPGAQIGQPGFGFATRTAEHLKVPQVGRVIVQDKVEIGACTTIDRGALGDTVIGEGTKIDNLVQIGHNTHIGRNCVIVAQVGISGSCELGDSVVMGGQAALADHVRVGSNARLAARAAAAPGVYEGGQDYGGTPMKPIREWARELAAVSMLVRKRKKQVDG